jgi:transposase InsO family protein
VQIAPSTYCDVKTRPPSARAVRDAKLVEDIKVAHRANLGVYGARKIHAELNREGIAVARCTVERLMRAAGLRGIPREKTRKTTVSDGAHTERPEDLVKRKFTATAPNQLWVADLTYARTHAGWTYVAFVLDVFSRMVVGWQVSTSLRTDVALDALDMGLWAGQRAGHDVTGLTHHSDRGVRAISSNPLHRAPGRSRGRRLRTIAWRLIAGVVRLGHRTRLGETELPICHLKDRNLRGAPPDPNNSASFRAQTRHRGVFPSAPSATGAPRQGRS